MYELFFLGKFWVNWKKVGEGIRGNSSAFLDASLTES